MMKQYDAINGWTKETILKHVEENWLGRSADNEDRCLYRGPNGTKCAIGLFIPDKLYNSAMENTSINKLYANNEGIKSFMPLEKEAMSLLQTIHDDAKSSQAAFDGIIGFIQRKVT